MYKQYKGHTFTEYVKVTIISLLVVAFGWFTTTVLFLCNPAYAATVGIIDTGVDATHEDFSNVTVKQWSYTEDLTDNVGHGTQIASIVAGENTELTIYSYKITDTAKSIKLSNIIQALDQVAIDKPDVLNMSLGLTKSTPELEKAINKVLNNGTIIVAAAGNKGNETKYYPAAYDRVIAVGANNTYGTRLDSSNYGNWVDYYIVGSNIASALPGHMSGFLTGTSAAAAKLTNRICIRLNKQND